MSMFAFGPWETQPLDNQITYRKQAQKELMEQFDGRGHIDALQIGNFSERKPSLCYFSSE